MPDQNDNKRALVPTHQNLPAVPADQKPRSILERMAAGALQIARQQVSLAVARRRVGDYELCEPDYRQILLWADLLNLCPEDVLAKLSETDYEYDHSPAHTFEVADGRIRTLVWPGAYLPLEAFKWVPGLGIEILAVIERMPAWLPEQHLPSLRELWVADLNLTELDLRPVPRLTELSCEDNQLTELDLSPVTGLTRLSCWSNQLTELDLSPVPELTELYCDDNQLTELDLSPVPELTILLCGGNQLTELDLSPVPKLTELECYKNQLTDLDLSPVPKLTKLWCYMNQLTELDLSPVPGLTELWCSNNQLTELDLRPVPKLSGNPSSLIKGGFNL